MLLWFCSGCEAIINNKYGQDPTNVGDEAGSAPNIQEKKEGLELLKIAIDKAGYTDQVVIKSADAASEFYSSDKTYYLCFNKENNDGSQKISGDALEVLYKPVVFKDPFDQDWNALLHKNLNYGGTGRRVLACMGQSSQSMEVDNAQVSKLQHNDEVDWKQVKRVFESFTRSFDELRFPIGARLEAMQDLICIANGHNDNTTMKRSSVTFTDKDMVVAGEHNRLLYVAAKINGFDIVAVIDSGSDVNLICLSTFSAACIPEKSIVPKTIRITGPTGQGYSLGHVTVDLHVGPIRSETHFDVINTNLPCHVLLGTPWIHKFEGVASTYHQCFKGKFQGQEVVIEACLTDLFES